jgi:hypothetical protein
MRFPRSSVGIAIAAALLFGGTGLSALSLGLSTSGLEIGLGSPTSTFALGLELDGGYRAADHFDSYALSAAIPIRFFALRWGAFRLGFRCAPFVSMTMYQAEAEYDFLDYFTEIDIGLRALEIQPELFVSENSSFFASLCLIEAGISRNLDSDGFYARIFDGASPSGSRSALAIGLRWYL